MNRHMTGICSGGAPCDGRKGEVTNRLMGEKCDEKRQMFFKAVQSDEVVEERFHKSVGLLSTILKRSVLCFESAKESALKTRIDGGGASGAGQLRKDISLLFRPATRLATLVFLSGCSVAPPCCAPFGGVQPCDGMQPCDGIQYSDPNARTCNGCPRVVITPYYDDPDAYAYHRGEFQE